MKKLKSLLHDIILTSLFLAPMGFLVIGALNYTSGNYDGTFMKELYPAIFIASVISFFCFIILGSIFKNASLAFSFVPTIVVFIVTVIAQLLKIENFIVFELVFVTIITMIFLIIFSLKNLKK